MDRPHLILTNFPQILWKVVRGSLAEKEMAEEQTNRYDSCRNIIRPFRRIKH